MFGEGIVKLLCGNQTAEEKKKKKKEEFLQTHKASSDYVRDA